MNTDEEQKGMKYGTKSEMLVRAEGVSDRSAVSVSLRTEPVQTASEDGCKRERKKALARAKQLRLYHKWKHDPEWQKRWKARRRAWYAKHAAKVKAKVTAYREANKAALRARKQQQRQADLAKARANGRAAYRRYRERIRAAARARYRKATPEQKALWNQRIKECHKRNAAELADSYVRSRLSRNSMLPAKAWPESLVELKRAELKLKRQVKLWENQKISTN